MCLRIVVQFILTVVERPTIEAATARPAGAKQRNKPHPYMQKIANEDTC